MLNQLENKVTSIQDEKLTQVNARATMKQQTKTLIKTSFQFTM